MKFSLLSRKDLSCTLFTCFSFLTPLSGFSQAPAITINAGIATELDGEQVLYVNGHYFAVFNAPFQVYTSPDAISWTQVTTPGNSLNGRMAYGAGRYVCVEDGGKIYSSTDLSNWMLYNTTLGPSGFLTDAEFLNGAFYVTGFAGNTSILLHSADGIVWDTIEVGNDGGLHDYYGIAYANGRFVLNDYIEYGNTILYTSPDASSGSWSADTISSGWAGRVRFLKDRFYFFGQSQVYVSADGGQWSPLSVPANPSSLFPIDGFYDGNKIFLVGYGNSPGNYGGLYTSSDGITFTGPILNSYPATGGTYVNHNYFVYSTGMAQSDDGINYHGLGNVYTGFASNGSGYVIAGYHQAGNEPYTKGFITRSTDFVTWPDTVTAVPAPGQPSSVLLPQLEALLYDGSRYLAFGNSALFTSTDGAAWQSSGLVPVAYSRAYGGGVYVSVGDSLCYSPDAVHWTKVPYPNIIINKVRYVNGSFYVMGETWPPTGQVPSVYASKTGSDWTDVSPNLPGVNGTIDDILYDGTKYYLMGAGFDANGFPRDFFSVSTSDINDPNSYGSVVGRVTDLQPGVRLSGYGTEEFSYSNGHFIGNLIDRGNAVGDSYLVYSSDGINWSSSSLNLTSSFTGIVATGDSFRMTGLNNILATVSFPGSPLPVSLLDFSAVAENNRSSLLTWQTATEENSRSFVIQRSTDGTKWDSIGLVTAAGISSTEKDYRFVDGSPSAGYDYYRLVLVDRDGRQQLSPVKSVYIGMAGAIKVFPNPAGDNVTIEMPGADGTSVLSIYNAAGLLVYRQELSGYENSLSLRVLPAGIYHLIIQQQNGRQFRQQLIHL
jgi:hypothetical protein